MSLKSGRWPSIPLMKTVAEGKIRSLRPALSPHSRAPPKAGGYRNGICPVRSAKPVQRCRWNLAAVRTVQRPHESLHVRFLQSGSIRTSWHIVTELDRLLELQHFESMCISETGPSGIECLLARRTIHGRILADGIQHHGILELRRHFTNDADRLRCPAHCR